VTGERTARLREAMASYPCGVTIVTTSDGDGRWWGFTARVSVATRLMTLTCTTFTHSTVPPSPQLLST
jgi:flavin reductase (DIM6/NTAB) family NADH-FMN oxidoreductase RutF